MPTLHLQVCAGFANRLRALISGICFAEDYNLQLVIHWFPMSPECFCRFGSVLDPESLPKTCKITTEDLFQATQVLNGEDVQKAFLKWDHKSDLYWKSYGIFYRNENWNTHLRAVKPSRAVRDLMERRCSSVDWSKAIGVHIRRGDNKKSIEFSTTEKFVERMCENTECIFVIATDDLQVRDQLALAFGDRCVFPAVTLSRKTEEGMIHGVSDFFALSKCPVLWGSYWSSFSEVAAWYGSSELTIV